MRMSWGWGIVVWRNRGSEQASWVSATSWGSLQEGTNLFFLGTGNRMCRSAQSCVRESSERTFKKNAFPMRVVKHLNRLPREMFGAPYLLELKRCLDNTLNNNMLSLLALKQSSLNLMDPEGPSQWNYFRLVYFCCWVPLQIAHLW